MRVGAPAAGLAAVLAACAATSAPPPPSWPDPEQRPLEVSPPAAAPALAVARVAGRPIPAAALVEAFWQWDTLAVRDQVERLATAEIARAEAARLGIVVPGEVVEARYRADLAELAQEVTGSGVAGSLEEFVTLRLGVDLDAFLARFRADSAQALLEERVVRAHLLGSERAELRVIVVEDAEALAASQADLAAGVPFAEVARARSVDPSARAGGVVTSIVRSERSPLARAAFATPVGQVGGPVVDGESGRRLLFLVEGRPAPVSGGWGTLGPLVEASLVETPVEDPEVWQWRAALQPEYPVDLLPLMRLVGEPAP